MQVRHIAVFLIFPLLFTLTACPTKKTKPVAVGGSTASINSITFPTGQNSGATIRYFGHADSGEYHNPGTLYLCGNTALESAVCTFFKAEGLMAHSGKVESLALEDIKPGVKFKADVSFPKATGAAVEFVQFVKHWFCVEFPGGVIKCARADDKYRLDGKIPWNNDEVGGTANIRYLDDSPEFSLSTAQRRDAIKARSFWDIKTFLVYFKPTGKTLKAEIIGKISWKVKLAIKKVIPESNEGPGDGSEELQPAPSTGPTTITNEVLPTWVWDDSAGGSTGAYNFKFVKYDISEPNFTFDNLQPDQETIQDFIDNWTFDVVTKYPDYSY